MRDSRFQLSRLAGGLAAALLAVGTVGASVLSAAPAPDARWQPWLGCWQPVAEPGAGAQPAAGTVVCVVADGDGVRVLSYAGGAQVSERRIVADGQPRPVTDDGCTGTGTARWSEDGFRVFLESDLSCGTRGETRGAGVMAILPGSHWLDARSVLVQDQPLMRVERYRLAGAEAMQTAGVPAGLVPAAATPETLARMAAASPLGTADVIEASRELRPELVQVLLAERHAGFDLDAATLEHLADAGVPGEVTDLMVALSNPDRFVVDAGSGEIANTADLQEEQPGREHVAYAPGARVYTGWDCGGFGYDPFWGSPYWGAAYSYGYGSSCGYGYGYGYGYGGYSPYGFGGGYGWSPYLPGQVIVVRGENSGESGGTMVPGHGYSHGSGGSASRTAHPRGSGASVQVPRGTSSGASSHSGSSGGGSSSSGSAPVRHAHPRGSHH